MTLPDGTGDQMQARCLSAGPDLFTSSAYRELFNRSQATAFQHPVWMENFARHVAPGRDAAMHCVIVTDGQGRDIAALSLITRRFSGAVMLEAADLGVSDYCAPVLDNGVASDALAILQVAAAMAAALPAHDIARFRNIRPVDKAFFETLCKAQAREAGFGAHATSLPASMDAWRATALTPSFNKYLARRVRKVESLSSARLRGIDDPQEAASAICTLAALRKGRFEGDMIARAEVEAFYAAIARHGTAKGFARVHVLEIDGVMAGITLGVRHQGAHGYLLIGCDYSAFGNLSPGLVLYDFAIAEWIKQGGTVFDFTIGDEAFKADFGTTAMPMSEMESAVSLIGRAALVARDVSRAFMGRLKA